MPAGRHDQYKQKMHIMCKIDDIHMLSILYIVAKK